MMSTCRILAICFLAAMLVACDDANNEQASSVDAGPDAGSPDAASDAAEGLPTTCEGFCREQSLSVDYGGTSATIERAVYGITAPDVSDSGEWEIYIEALEGGFDGCPQQDSPTPDWSLILSGLPAALADTTLTRADDGLAATFLDYDGRFLGEEPFVRATDVSVTPVAANIDTELVIDGVDHEDGVVALDVEASFDDGSITGHLVATHCASMDEAGE
ncbi:MAG: hypothetical protein ACOC9J_01530 [Persicimonas sp.]